jgi:hypothetical protein
MIVKFNILDNFFEQDSFLEVKKFIMSPRCQWRFVDFIAHKDRRDNDKDGYFVHSFTDRDPNTLKERFQESPNLSILSNLMKKIREKVPHKDILRVRSSLYPRRNSQNPDPMHLDYTFPHNVCIYYVNTNNGYTMFDNGEKVSSLENRLLVFNGLEKHCSVVQTDASARFIININIL